jgi:hypothetical protein
MREIQKRRSAEEEIRKRKYLFLLNNGGVKVKHRYTMTEESQIKRKAEEEDGRT